MHATFVTVLSCVTYGPLVGQIWFGIGSPSVLFPSLLTRPSILLAPLPYLPHLFVTWNIVG